MSKKQSRSRSQRSRTQRSIPSIRKELKIVVLADGNPRRPGTRAHKLFGKYRTGITVGQFYDKAKSLGRGAAPANRGDVAWDVRKGHIKLRRSGGTENGATAH